MARVLNAHASEDIWHLSIEDLLATPDVPRVAGPGPFVINLKTSGTAISPPPRGLLRFDRLHIYQIVRSHEGETQYRLRLGLIKSQAELEAILAKVREHYPGAMQETAEADDEAAVAAVTRATDLARPPARSDTDARRVQVPARPSSAPRAMQEPARVSSSARTAPPIAAAPTAVAAPSPAPSRIATQATVPAPRVAAPRPTQRAAAATVNEVVHAAVHPVAPSAPQAAAASEQDYGWDIDELLPDLARDSVSSAARPPARAFTQKLAYDPNAVTDQFEALAEPEVDPQRNPPGELHADPLTDPTVELEAESLREPEIELQAETETVTEPEIELQAAPLSDAPDELEAETLSDPVIELESETFTEPEIELESESITEPSIELEAEPVELAEPARIAPAAALSKPVAVTRIELAARVEIPTLHPAPPPPPPAPAPVRVQPPPPAAAPAPPVQRVRPQVGQRLPEESGTLERLVAKIDAMIESAETHDKSARATLRAASAAPSPARTAPPVAAAAPAPARAAAPVAAVPPAARAVLSAAPAAPSTAPAAPSPGHPPPSRSAPAGGPPRAGAPLMDSTQTVRALSLDELAEPEDAQWFAIELARGGDQIAAEHVPNLDIFSEYRLYSITGLDQDRVVHVLRVGFFSSEVAAEAVAGYLGTYFEAPAVKRVSHSERERFAERRVRPRKDVGATGTHAVIELVAPAPLPERSTEPAVGDSGKRPALDAAALAESGKRRALEGTSLWSRLLSPRNR